jgi:hypothetical protein
MNLEDTRKKATKRPRFKPGKQQGLGMIKAHQGRGRRDRTRDVQLEKVAVCLSSTSEFREFIRELYIYKDGIKPGNSGWNTEGVNELNAGKARDYEVGNCAIAST